MRIIIFLCLTLHFCCLNAKKAAVCYWGLTRSTKLVYQSHIEKLFRVLTENDIEYDVFMHTWTTEGKQRVWHRETDVPIDYDEYKLLNPKYFQRDDQDQFIRTVHLGPYINRTAKGVWAQPKIMQNYICALESQKRVTDMVLESHNSYDWVIYVRPDAQLLDEFPIHELLHNLNDDTILIPNFDHWGGYNDRFAALTLNTAPKYGKRLNGLLNYKKKAEMITSERYLKFVCTKNHLKVIFINFNFVLVRPQ